ncbi:hypothetical protein QG37_00084 [Candidozyma auris]|nr:hypothetical protein QG37_00084 [[Candida] auris]
MSYSRERGNTMEGFEKRNEGNRVTQNGLLKRPFGEISVLFSYLDTIMCRLFCAVYIHGDRFAANAETIQEAQVGPEQA